jgi:tetratricopeptide (TPR) repeat protein
MRQFQAQAPIEEVRNSLKDMVPGVPSEDLEIDAIKADEESNSFSFTFHGESRIAWTRVAVADALRIKFDDDVIEWQTAFEREDKSQKDVPFSLGFPVHLASRETIILPAGGAGFRIEATDFDREVAGTRIARTVRMEGGKAVAVSSYIRLRSEISAAEAAAAIPILTRINDDNAYVRSPDHYRVEAASGRKAAGGSSPHTARDDINRGFQALSDGRYADALADFDRALILSPRDEKVHANRAIALIRSGKYEDGRAALAMAESLPGADKDFLIGQGYGLLHLAQDRPAEAAEAFTRSLALDPENAVSIAERASAYIRDGRFADAFNDLDRAIALDATDLNLLGMKARLAAVRGDQRVALATADRLIAIEDGTLIGHALKGEIFQQFGKKPESAQSYARAIELLDGRIAAESDETARAELGRQRLSLLIESGRVEDALAQSAANLLARPDDATDLNEACWARVLANIELDKALEQCERSLAIDPDNAATIDSRAWVKLRLGRLEDSIADFDRALGLSPEQSASLYGRGAAKLRKGDREAGERDLAAARRLDFAIDSQFQRYGLAP